MGGGRDAPTEAGRKEKLLGPAGPRIVQAGAQVDGTCIHHVLGDVDPPVRGGCGADGHAVQIADLADRAREFVGPVGRSAVPQAGEGQGQGDGLAFQEPVPEAPKRRHPGNSDSGRARVGWAHGAPRPAMVGARRMRAGRRFGAGSTRPHGGSMGSGRPSLMSCRDTSGIEWRWGRVLRDRGMRFARRGQRPRRSEVERDGLAPGLPSLGSKTSSSASASRRSRPRSRSSTNTTDVPSAPARPVRPARWT